MGPVRGQPKLAHTLAQWVKIGMRCPHTPVPQVDRTVLRLRSAVQLGPFELRMNGPSNSAKQDRDYLGR